MTPPPITTSFSGTEFNARAPVDDTTTLSSKGRNGNAIGSDPVAIMNHLDLMRRPPTSISLGDKNFAKPRIDSTLCCLKRDPYHSSFDDIGFSLHHQGEIGDDPRGDDAEIFGFLCKPPVVFRRLQQCFRRDASHVEASAPKRFIFFYACRFKPEVPPHAQLLCSRRDPIQ